MIFYFCLFVFSFFFCRLNGRQFHHIKTWFIHYQTEVYCFIHFQLKNIAMKSILQFTGKDKIHYYLFKFIANNIHFEYCFISPYICWLIFLYLFFCCCFLRIYYFSLLFRIFYPSFPKQTYIFFSNLPHNAFINFICFYWKAL